MAKIKLTDLQKDVLRFFGKNSFGKNFYWTGGTLLSYYYLSHRDSIDLDFFSDNLYSDEEYLIFINSLKKEVQANKIIFRQELNRKIYLAKRGKENVKLELVFFPFPNYERRKKLVEFSINIDSLSDIMINKTLSAYQRNEPKDAFDLYVYLSQKPKYNLLTLIRLVEKKFGVAIEPALLLAKLNKLSDELSGIEPLLLLPQKNLSEKAKSFFQDIFNSFSKKWIK
ncbi:MAG: nucleotidyl transferase AbiEii/AbiGii toxin family protein [Patescibacteria group bacterium]|nr:nucleotidyl transferase AbiEii/AbiGii toxin family protein [Patescibacteria group bacterium]